MSIASISKFKELRCCVIIPTYNNAKTLKRVIDGVKEYTQDILIVNDGSTDKTASILEAYSDLNQIHIKQNQGKGNALRVGFDHAVDKGYHHAISIDSDGQHFPSDLPLFLKVLEEDTSKDLLLIGARNMTQLGVPKKSSFGNKFSNFWFWFETGIWLTDTQSGYRLYPLNVIKDITFYTKKFEFEIEVIVKAAWRGVAVKNVPIEVLYDEAERVSHFRPFKDFTRISILNTWLVIVSLFVIKPRDLYRKFKKKGLRKFLSEDVFGHDDPPRKKAFSIALGIFIGLSPFWGFHTIIVLFLAAILNLNKAIAFTCSQISLPPFIPFVLYASKVVGSFILGTNDSYNLEDMMRGEEMLGHLKTYLVGSFTLATLCSIAFGVIGYFMLVLFQSKPQVVENS